MFSDGSDDCRYFFPKYYANTCVDYGQLVNVRESGKGVDKKRRIVSGSPFLEDIKTIDMGDFNDALREWVGRLFRKTKCHSKREFALINAVGFIHSHWNFMNPLHDKMTPTIMNHCQITSRIEMIF